MPEDLKAKFNADLNKALKEKDSLRVSILRLLLAVFHNREIEKRTQKQNAFLEEEDILNILLSEVKKRREAAEIYEKGKRSELAEKEREEIKIIQEYLPSPLNQEEVERIIEQVIKEIGAGSLKDLGRVMGGVMKQVRGRFEASAVSQLVRERLASFSAGQQK